VQVAFIIFVNFFEYLWIVIISKVHGVSCTSCSFEVFAFHDCVCGLDFVTDMVRKTSAVN
jgi:hypothetical protein